MPDWRSHIERFGQVAAVQRRASGSRWTNPDIFEAILRAVLSGATDWSRIERVLDELESIFFNFDLCRYSTTSEATIRQTIIPWFTSRRANSLNLARSLILLTRTTTTLCLWSREQGSADSYFTTVVNSVDELRFAARELGGSNRQWKLPGLGLPLAAETLRNLGFDLAKPDRHVNRAFGSFGVVAFRNWKNRSGTNAPLATEAEMLDVMAAAEHMAGAVQHPICFVDNAIWLLCAKRPSGLFLSNADLVSLAS